MKRRALLAAIALAPAMLRANIVAAAAAQSQPRVWRIGILHPRSKDTPGSYRFFVKGLHEIGYVEGRHFNAHWVYADNDPNRLAVLAAELVRLRVDVIVTNGTPAVEAAQKATRTIPIVALTIGDPVKSGLAASLSRPGGNITGFSNAGLQIAPKRMELLRTAVPSAVRVAYLFNPAFMLGLPDVEAAARTTGRELLPVKVGAASELSDAFSHIVRERAAALIVADDNMLLDHWRTLGAHALKAKLPSIFPWSVAAESALLVYRGVFRDIGRRSALLVERILKGANPGDLPFEEPTNFDLVVNLRMARTLGLAIPHSLLLQASRVIE